ncbi:peptide deformylase [Candidatus Nomurabacteria bacterium]|nr:peptide deformylase [Candidatus Nomurabacteria bacterium]
MAEIIQRDNPLLRQVAKQVAEKEFGTIELKKILEEMVETLTAEPDGIALAAPQIGISKRIFIVKMPEEKNLVFINPIITKLSKKKEPLEEGCLSVRWLYGQVDRAEKASVEAYDQNGQKFTRHGTGLMAQIFQHEIDHLNGELFIDKAQNLEEFRPENRPND